MNINWTQKPTSTKKIYNIPIGGYTDKQAVIKYYFGDIKDFLTNPALHQTTSQLNDTKIETYPDELKDIIRQAYKIIGQYINTKFE